MSATNDATLITDPPPVRSIAGIAARQHRNVPRRLTAIVRSQISSAVEVIELSRGSRIPALLTRMSSEPNAASVSATIRSTSAGLVTSAWTNRPSPPVSYGSSTMHGERADEGGGVATKEREVSAPALEQLLLDYRARIGHARMPETVREEALRQLERLATTPAEGFEHYVIRGYLE